MKENDVLVKMKQVTKSYGKKVALQDLSFSIPKGKIIGLLGPNGSGKTTVIKLLSGLLQPNQGEVLVLGEKPSLASKRIISYLPDTSYFNDYMKIKDLLSLFEDFYADFDANRARELLLDLNLDIEGTLKNLSKGNKEKVQLILVMSRKAQLYILDEPIGGVDPAARDYILKTIVGNYSKDASVLISTHLISDVEPILDQVLFIKNGDIVLDGEVDELRQQYQQSIDSLFREKFKV